MSNHSLMYSSSYIYIHRYFLLYTVLDILFSIYYFILYSTKLPVGYLDSAYLLCSVTLPLLLKCVNFPPVGLIKLNSTRVSAHVIDRGKSIP